MGSTERPDSDSACRPLPAHRVFRAGPSASEDSPATPVRRVGRPRGHFEDLQPVLPPLAHLDESVLQHRQTGNHVVRTYSRSNRALMVQHWALIIGSPKSFSASGSVLTTAEENGLCTRLLTFMQPSSENDRCPTDLSCNLRVTRHLGWRLMVHGPDRPTCLTG